MIRDIVPVVYVSVALYILDLAFSSFPRMKCAAVGVGDCHPSRVLVGTLNPMHGNMGAG